MLPRYRVLVSNKVQSQIVGGELADGVRAQTGSGSIRLRNFTPRSGGCSLVVSRGVRTSMREGNLLRGDFGLIPNEFRLVWRHATRSRFPTGLRGDDLAASVTASRLPPDSID